ncbi:histidine--tRNA ligase [Thermoplasmatales archaeon SW_10_69_26]|nr:MAG: histidine--tRNA ligase [Thermoplasmatales archaeon SW_10_69_26]
MASFDRPRGTRDFDPEEMADRNALITRLREAFETFGYREIGTPTFEHLDLFTAKSGPEIVEQLYAFEDKSERELTLRPELTAPVMRFYNEELRARPKPLRLFYFGNCFRYERPQSGRYREFWQFGAELVGAPGPAGDAEIIALAEECVQAAGAATELHVGHIGILDRLIEAVDTDEDTHSELYRLVDKGGEELTERLDEVDAEPVLAEAIEDLAVGANPTIALAGDEDELRERFGELLAEVRGFSDEAPHLDKRLREAFDEATAEAIEAALDELATTLGHLAGHGVDEVHVDLGVARGLDYYTGVVFEVEAPELGAQSQVAGGGRYQLAETLGGQPTDTTGFGLGFDRLLLAADVETEEAPARAHVVPIAGTLDEATSVAADLRAAGIPTTVDLRDRSIGKNLDYVDRLGVPKAILLGPDELEQGVATVKDMASGEQTEVALDELVGELSSD